MKKIAVAGIVAIVAFGIFLVSAGLKETPPEKPQAIQQESTNPQSSLPTQPSPSQPSSSQAAPADQIKPELVKNTLSCAPSYPDFCIPPPPPDLDCKDISQKKFTVLQPDPHHFDADKDGIGCE